MADRTRISDVTALAYWLDRRLRERFGRPYRGILSAGLVIGIVGTVEALSKAFSKTNIAALATTVVFQVALLINQLAQMHEFRQERRARREARKAGETRRDDAVS
jgi:hypothetical protein